MALFVVTYDMKGANDSQSIRDVLEKLDSCRIQESVWYVEYDDTTKALFNYLQDNVQENDRLMVVEFFEKPKYKKSMRGTLDWINRKFP